AASSLATREPAAQPSCLRSPLDKQRQPRPRSRRHRPPRHQGRSPSEAPPVGDLFLN
ncbi:unnamed protein product, partial [Gulo gulo]